MTPLEALLDEVKSMVRAADFSGLADVAPRLEAALAGLGKLSDAGLLKRLKAKADENASLLDASQRGLRAARRRIDESRRAAFGLQTYDVKGRRADIGPVAPTAGRF